MWKVRNVICRRCGFAFVAPVPSEKMLSEYYGDSFELSQVNYSIEKRIEVISRHACSKKASFLEIGGNNNSDFLRKLSSHVGKVHTLEINMNCESEFRTAGELQKNSIDVAVAYFVLEHVTRPRDFLLKYRGLIRDGGIFIIEVPNLYIYPQNPAGIFQCEHVNHFSPVSLARMAESCGFQMIEVSQEECSRPFGFVAVLKKMPAKMDKTKNPSEYLFGKSCMIEGFAKVSRLLKEMESARKRIFTLSKNGEQVVIWGANWICLRLLDDLELPPSAIVVDRDPQKETYFENVRVLTPEYAIKHIKKSSYFVINTRYYSSEIISWIAKFANRKLKPDEYSVLDYY